MKKPELELEAAFNKNGVFFKENFELPKGKYVSLDIEIGVPAGSPILVPDFTVEVLSKRNYSTIFRNWDKEQRGDQDILKIEVLQRVPEGVEFKLQSYPQLTQSFVDLCWYAGNEAVTRDYVPDVFTKLRNDAQCTDLGWYLPSRVTDTFIDAVGKIDDTMLAGMIENALIYLNCPFVKE